MNFNQRFECCTCNGLIDCRIGMSNRDIQQFKFACPHCAESIYVTLTQGKGWKIKNAKMIEDFEGPFNGTYPFIDLHLDFPVSFEKYEMGNTPFFQAIARIGYDKFQIHNARLNALNEIYKLSDELERIIRLYKSNKNIKLFSLLSEKHFHEKMISEKPEDINLVLYSVIAKAFFPFSMPEENATSVRWHLKAIRDASETNSENFKFFIEEITTTNFLKNIQQDCLEIYPKILNNEIAFRPALFLDFDDNYKNGLVALRVSIDDFEKYKDLYKDISEIMSRAMTLIAGLNNIIHRGNFNSFADNGKNTPRSLSAFADLAYGYKLDHLDNCWYEFQDSAVDNQLRNSIAHYKAEYDEISQQITYYPRKEGIKQEKSENIYFLDFMRKILISYREMHRMHQLIKCLLNYNYLIHMKTT
jgi:hypothetical protein